MLPATTSTEARPARRQQPVASGITGTSYIDTGLSNGTTYYYTIKAVDIVGTGGPSSEVHAVPLATDAPAAPTNLAATGGHHQVALSWAASAGAATYDIYRGTSAGGESATPIATGLTSPSYTDTGLTNGTTYFYEVTALNSGGTSGNSNEASATPAATAGTPR